MNDRRSAPVIGPYQLVEQIGEGRFALVFRAEQTEPVRRQVALKVLKPGMDQQVVARFEAERQALAMMDHVNIARVFDGGTTEAGRPYFVMELVKGVPITDYCDQNRVTLRARLELFVQLCRAVQHAHHKCIIHRDLKPSEVLVTVDYPKPVVKLIDFGLAKATEQKLTERTLFIRFAPMIGTPPYMSPEQAGQSGLDIDTRSDIYSLGVLLYELLTGTTPFVKERFQGAADDEIRRILREDAPPKPSARLSRSEDALLRDELDAIVMKCMEKDRSRRYETADALAQDVEHCLNDEPVAACPPSACVRVRKFVRRNQHVVAIVAVVAVAMLIAAISLWAMEAW